MNVVTFANPPAVAPPASSYSHLARVDLGDTALLFVSGQGALDRDGRLVGENDMRAQSEQTFANLQSILEAEGGDLGDVVKLTIYLTDVTRRAEMAEVRGRLFTDFAPTATAVEVSGLALPGLLVQIDAIAAITSAS